MLTNALLVIAATYLIGDWLAGASVAVLIVVWRLLPTREGPPVLPLAITTQWLQVSVGVFYHGLTGRPLDATLHSDYRPMVMIGLGCVLALTVGLRYGRHFMDGMFSEAPPAPKQLLRMPTLVVAYGGGVVVTVIMQEIAFRYPTFTQAILALSFLRFLLIYLLLRRFLQQERMRWDLVAGLVVFEMVLGFTGYFSGFKEPLVLAGMATLEIFDRRQVRHWAIAVGLVVVLVGASVIWMGVRGQFRRDFEDEVFASSRSARLARIQTLASDWLGQRSDRTRLDEMDELINRAWAIYYPALAIERVPGTLPFTDGQLIINTFTHLITPRILFPDKPGLPSDSEMVRKYSGINVAGPEQQTSIAFGYAAESYIDFGMPLMFAPVLVFGLLMGAIYQWFLRSIIHRELAVAMVVCIFWINLYLFERSWSVILGFAFTMMAYLGLVAFTVDRWVMMRSLDQFDRQEHDDAAA